MYNFKMRGLKDLSEGGSYHVECLECHMDWHPNICAQTNGAAVKGSLTCPNGCNKDWKIKPREIISGL